MKANIGSRFNPAIEGRTLLIRAAFKGDLEMAVALLQEGLHVNERDAGGDTALPLDSF